MEKVAKETARLCTLQNALMSPRLAKVGKKVASKTKLDHSDIGCVGIGSTGQQVVREQMDLTNLQ